MRSGFFISAALLISLCLSFQAQDPHALPHGLIAPLPGLEQGAKSPLTLDRWENSHRQEILSLFGEHVYGKVPEMNVQVQSRVTRLIHGALGGRAVMKEVEILLIGEADTVLLQMLMFLPSRKPGPHPLFLGLNFNGNHTIHPDTSISLTQTKLRNRKEYHITDNRATEASRGVSASRWPVEMILDRSYGLASIYCGDIDVDEDDGFWNGVHGLDRQERDSASWATISAWAWGLSRAMDYLASDPEVDASRVAVIGHSRLGKTALWAGACDQRFAMLVSNNSGCGGAALSRRRVGESISRINSSFPHWFADRFNDYNDREEACPVDQHMLLALMAPRPLYVASASEDEWADPEGEYLSLYYGSKVYPLYGMESLENPEPPGPDTPRWRGNVGYHLRTGKHDITAWDWEQYLDFADTHMLKN